MLALRSLCLVFEKGSAQSISAWNAISKTPVIATLEQLELQYCLMNAHDYTSFVLKHIDSLVSLDIERLGLYDCTVHDIRAFYAELSKAPKLKFFYQYGLGLGGFDWNHWVKLPLHLCFPHLAHVDENEDGYVEFELWSRWIRWKGRDEVRRVLVELAVSLF